MAIRGIKIGDNQYFMFICVGSGNGHQHPTSFPANYIRHNLELRVYKGGYSFTFLFTIINSCVALEARVKSESIDNMSFLEANKKTPGGLSDC